MNNSDKIGGITELFRPSFSKTLVLGFKHNRTLITQNQVSIYTKPRFRLFVIPTNMYLNRLIKSVDNAKLKLFIKLASKK